MSLNKKGLAYVPPELLAQIISQLRALEIVRIQLVSRLFNNLVRTSIRLQYLIELGVAGYVDRSTSLPISTEERLRSLKAKRAIWKIPFAFEEIKSISLPDANTRYFHFSEDWVMRVFKPRDHHSNFWSDVRVGVMDLAEDSPAASWKSDVDFNPTGLCIDPHQDLIILAELKSDENIDHVDLSVLSLKNGTPHPETSSPRLRITLPQYTYLACREIHVSGHLLAVRLGGYSEKGISSEINMVDWRTGAVIVRLSVPAESVLGMCLISPRYILLSRFEGQPISQVAIEVHQLPIDPDQTTTTLIATYEFPRLSEKRRAWLSLHSSSTRTFVPSQSDAPFSLDPMSGMIYMQFFVDRTETNKSYRIFSPISTFLPLDDAAPGPFIRHSWDSWGPRSTRWFPLDNLSLFTPKFYAYRFMNTQCIYDFNPLEVARDLSLRDKTSRDTEEEGEKDQPPWSRLVTRSTTIPHQGIFVRNITSTLPYRETDFGKPFPMDTGIASYDQLVRVELDEWSIPKAVTFLAPVA